MVVHNGSRHLPVRGFDSPGEHEDRPQCGPGMRGNTMSARKPLKGLVIQPNGNFEWFEISRDDELTRLQGFVGGWIEAVMSEDERLTFYVNEEGKLTGLPMNALATMLWYKSKPAVVGLDVLCGPVVLVGGVDQHGNTKSLPIAALRALGPLAEDFGIGTAIQIPIPPA